MSFRYTRQQLADERSKQDAERERRNAAAGKPKAKTPPRVKPPAKPVLRFQYQGGVVKAKSRVDARSVLKRKLGIPIKGRLPAGTLIVCLSA